VSPFPLDVAKAQLEAEAEALADVMAKSSIISTKVKDILSRADACQNAVEIAGLIRELREAGHNPFAWGR
jgi:hypothetical protein